MIIQNAVQKCKEFTKVPILVLYHAVGYALVVDWSKKTITHNETILKRIGYKSHIFKQDKIRIFTKVSSRGNRDPPKAVL